MSMRLDALETKAAPAMPAPPPSTRRSRETGMTAVDPTDLINTRRTLIAVTDIYARPQDVPAKDPCPATHETVARDRPWPPGTAHAAGHEPGPPEQIPTRRN
ncbi:MAG: hypothetical protein ACRDTH_24160 [Pseudonocardiaceae bacterium]